MPAPTEQEAPPSACSSCRKPGRCCAGFSLNAVSLRSVTTALEAEAWARQVPNTNTDGSKRVGVPFLPLLRSREGNWYWWCPELDPATGRCKIYAERPQVCASYAPLTDGLCAMYAGVPLR